MKNEKYNNNISLIFKKNVENEINDEYICNFKKLDSFIISENDIKNIMKSTVILSSHSFPNNIISIFIDYKDYTFESCDEYLKPSFLIKNRLFLHENLKMVIKESENNIHDILNLCNLNNIKIVICANNIKNIINNTNISNEYIIINDTIDCVVSLILF